MFLELGTFAEEPEPYSESLSQFSSRGGQIPGIDDGEMPVVPARSEESTVTGQHTMTGIHQSFLFCDRSANTPQPTLRVVIPIIFFICFWFCFFKTF